MAALSATLIVRDESRYLADCLRSLAELVDEVVVVDTGSVDDTVEIARGFGARVFRHDWTGNFAVARNIALAHATGDWVLYIDADERVRTGSRATLDAALAEEHRLGLYVLFHPKTGYTAYREMRLFRKRPDIRFEGVIHENIWPALQRHMRSHGDEIGDSGLVIDHHGYEGDQRAKHARNLPLLERALADDPDRVYCWYHLGVVHRSLGEPDFARSAWQAGIEVVRRKGALAGGSLPYLHVLEMDMEASRCDRALLEEAQRLFPDHAHLVWLDARMHLMEGSFREAIARFERLLHWPVETDLRTAYDRRLFGVHARLGLATSYFALKDYARAGQQFAFAEAAEPGCLEYRVKRQLCAYLATRSDHRPT